ncbi:hypothetical protein MHU86_8609 [Fragilaria crotonensis]|nr:hypothetical protein MHU86_8609 [Fragilaria crotonensis]
MIGLIHWVQDFGRVGEVPTLEGIDDAVTFGDAVDGEAYQLAEVRKIEKDQSDTVSKEANPGKFLSLHYPGVNGIPLSYVIQENKTLDSTMEYPCFNKRAVACTPFVWT